MDSEKAATSAAGPLANLPLLETGFFKARDFREGLISGQWREGLMESNAIVRLYQARAS
jgi:hypothetical protein